jgi:hypothetical protein
MEPQHGFSANGDGRRAQEFDFRVTSRDRKKAPRHRDLHAPMNLAHLKIRQVDRCSLTGDSLVDGVRMDL